VVLLKLMFFPYPEFFVYPYLTNNGLKPYAQILDQHFPGLMFLPINFDNLGMNSELEARVWLIGVVIITQLLLFIVARLIFKNNYKALIANALYLTWQPFFEGFVFWIDNLMPLFSLSGFYFVYKYSFEKQKNIYLLMAGLILGTGVVFKQTFIPLTVLIAFYLLWKTRSFKNVSIFSFISAVPITLTSLYYLSQNIFNDFWYWTVTFNLTAYSKFGLQVERPLGYFTRILLVFGTSFLSVFSNRKKELVLLGVFFMGSIFGSFDRLDFVHLQPVLPFAILTTVMGFEAIFVRKYFRLFIFAYIFISLWWLGVFYKGHISEKVLFFDESTKKLAGKIMENTNKGEKIFVFGAAPHLYQMSNTLPAGGVFVFQFPWFTRIAEDRILDGLKKDKPNIIVYDSNPKFNDQHITEYMSKTNEYIIKNYHVFDQVGDTKIMRKN